MSQESKPTQAKKLLNKVSIACRIDIKTSYQNGFKMLLSLVPSKNVAYNCYDIERDYNNLDGILR